jgi:hypothetical protein
MASLLLQEPPSTVLRPLPTAEVRALLDTLAGDRMFSRLQAECGRRRLPISFRVWYNANGHHPDRDGAVWQGKGFTASLTGGFNASIGPLEAVFQPLAFITENRAYSPTNLAPVPADFRDPFWGQAIDLPYRFGRSAYASLEPGESIVQVSYFGAAVGATTRSQHWGPAHFYPLVMGTEGPAFPRVFVEVTRFPLRIADATANWQVGFLEDSRHSGLSPGNRSRLAVALTASIRPAVFRSLEIGGARLFHVRRERGSLNWSTATLPFTGLLKQQSSDQVIGGFNQLGSVFFRAAAPRGGAEFYGEFYREDHNHNLDDLIAEPDHQSAYMLGFRRVLRRNSVMDAVTLEHANGRISHIHRIRGQSPIYVHSPLTEGHTHRGQPLGSSALLGGTGTMFMWNRIHVDRTLDLALEVKATAQNTEGGRWNGERAGVYVFRLGRSQMFGARTYGGSIEFLHGYGAERGKKAFTVGLNATR